MKDKFLYFTFCKSFKKTLLKKLEPFGKPLYFYNEHLSLRFFIHLTLGSVLFNSVLQHGETITGTKQPLFSRTILEDGTSDTIFLDVSIFTGVKLKVGSPSSYSLPLFCKTRQIKF